MARLRPGEKARIEFEIDDLMELVDGIREGGREGICTAYYSDGHGRQQVDVMMVRTTNGVTTSITGP